MFEPQTSSECPPISYLSSLYNSMLLSTLVYTFMTLLAFSIISKGFILTEIVVLSYIPNIILLSNRCGILVGFTIRTLEQVSHYNPPSLNNLKIKVFAYITQCKRICKYIKMLQSICDKQQ